MSLGSVTIAVSFNRTVSKLLMQNCTSKYTLFGFECKVQRNVHYFLSFQGVLKNKMVSSTAKKNNEGSLCCHASNIQTCAQDLCRYENECAQDYVRVCISMCVHKLRGICVHAQFMLAMCVRIFSQQKTKAAAGCVEGRGLLVSNTVNERQQLSIFHQTFTVRYL